MTWLRAFAVISILLCHYVQESTNVYVRMSAQFFNIGVNIFFIISGFCFGLQGDIKDGVSWYKKRLKRIYIPYWGFLLFLALVYMILKLNFNLQNWLLCILGMQGARVGVLGADHTWFITVILLCYFITPFMAKKSIRKEWFAVGLLPIVLSLIPHPSAYTLLNPVCFYILAYFVGRIYTGNHMTWKKAAVAFVMIAISFIIRFGMKIFADGTILYDRIIVTYTQYIAAFAIFALAAFVFKNIKASKYCKEFCKMSFEVYLCHYMFVVGPVSIMHSDFGFAVNMVLTTVITCMTALILNSISGMVQKKIVI